ncbi:MAG: flavodoxin domain-containing protein [Polyangia bacterium]
MRVLVTFGSNRGGTQGLAETVAEELRAAGHHVDVLPASLPGGPDELTAWDAVIVGGALYAGRWQRHARRFVQRHDDELTQLPVWFFSSGPLDDSAERAELPPTAQVRRLMERIGARGHATFGGRLSPEAQGFIAHAMVKQGRAGDWRDPEHVRTWARGIGQELAQLPARASAAPAPSGRGRRLVRGALSALCSFTGVTALVGGAQLIGWPDGSAPGMNAPLALLRHSPFHSFLVPGLLLFFLVGLLNMVAALLTLRRHRLGEVLAFAGGASTTIWIIVERLLLRESSFLQLLYLGLGLVTLAASLWLWQKRHAAVRSHRAAAAAT